MTGGSPVEVPRIAVVIPTRDRPSMVEGAVRAVASQLSDVDELVVVDSASLRRTDVVSVAEAAGARVVRCDVPGVARARNAGLRATESPVVAFTDDDCRPSQDWLSVIRVAFRDHALGVMTGRVLSDAEGSAFGLSINLDDRRRRLSAIADLGVGQAGNMAVRRQAAEAVLGFDEAMGPGAWSRSGEDNDFLWRILRAGWNGLYEPRLVVTHLQWRSPRRALRSYFNYGTGAGTVAAKVRRIDPSVGRGLVGRRLWQLGLVLAGRNLLAGRKAGAAAAALNAAGTAYGAVRSWRVPVEGGHFRR
jgi:glycosyltransferase involved in cell wall biosynthesis